MKTNLITLSVLIYSLFTLACSSSFAATEQTKSKYQWKEDGKMKTMWLDSSYVVEFKVNEQTSVHESSQTNNKMLKKSGLKVLKKYSNAKLWEVAGDEQVSVKNLVANQPNLSPVFKFTPKYTGQIVAVNNKMIVKFAKGVSEADKSALFEKYGLTVLSELISIGYYQVATSSSDKLLSTVQALANNDSIVTAAPDFWRPIKAK